MHSFALGHVLPLLIYSAKKETLGFPFFKFFYIGQIRRSLAGIVIQGALRPGRRFWPLCGFLWQAGLGAAKSSKAGWLGLALVQ